MSKFLLLVFSFVWIFLPLIGNADSNPGEDGIEILTGFDSMTVEVNLKPLGEISPAMRAILALYAMRANGGCPPGEWNESRKYVMECPLTTALNLGSQCSEEEIALVKSWFKNGIPALNLSPEDAAEINKTGDFDSACNSTPYTATHQSIWTSIRVKKKDDALVTVIGEGSWTEGPEGDSGDFKTRTTYRIQKDRIEVVEHQEDP